LEKSLVVLFAINFTHFLAQEGGPLTAPFSFEHLNLDNFDFVSLEKTQIRFLADQLQI